MTFESCSRVTIHFVNLFMLVTGIIVLTVSSIFLSNFSDTDNEALSKRGVKLGIFLSLYTIFTACLGSWAAYKRHRKSLLVYAASLFVIFIAFVIVYAILISYVNVFETYEAERDARFLFQTNSSHEKYEYDEKYRDVNDFEIGLWNGCCVAKYENAIPGLRPIAAICTRSASGEVVQGWPCIYGTKNLNPGPVTCRFLEVLDIFGAKLVGNASHSQGCGIYPSNPHQYFTKQNATTDELLWQFSTGLYEWFDKEMSPYVVLMLCIGIVMFVSIIMALCIRTGTDPTEIDVDNKIKRASMEMVSPMERHIEGMADSEDDHQDPEGIQGTLAQV